MATLSSCTLDINKLPIVRRKFSEPPLKQITEAILPELSKAFETVSVVVVQCPDLTQPPFHLAAEGLGGDETAIHIGSLWNLMPLAKLEKLYDMKDIKQITGSDPLFVIGAGAGPWPYAAGVCSEWVGNVCMTSDNEVNNRSHLYKTNTDTGSITHEALPNNETRFAHMANLYTSNGLKGEVLKIVCETRKGSSDFLTTIREALKKSFGDETVCLGGVILIENGKVKVHVYPHYSKTPIYSEVDLKNWLKFYEVHTPLVGLGYIASHDPGLNMMPIQHFHLFSNHGSGGHYLHDTEPTTIKYTAYLNVAKNFIRIDQPEVPFSFRKD